MNCPRCKSENTKCVDSRPSNTAVHRRKKCMDCNYRWNTMEITVDRHKELLKAEAYLEDLLNYASDLKQTMKGSGDVDNERS